ncbi:site-2 protease family protein [Evansella cellulosilytica]|uniref:site-2 protease family protein n=1 Tax=Evansella cellulosilytica TaxID=1413 RepID=UPI0012F6A9B4|nr:site-2 protease family protein [Evansella cellulosilytica]
MNKEQQFKPLSTTIVLIFLFYILHSIITIIEMIALANSGVEGIVYFCIGLGLVTFSFILTVALHEIGHLVIGGLVGYKLKEMTLGPIKFTRGDDGFRLQFQVNENKFGAIQMESVNDKYMQVKDVFYSLGGIILNFVSAIIALALFLQGDNYFANIFFQSLFMINLLFFLVNSIPARYGERYTDGFWLYHAVKRMTQ